MTDDPYASPETPGVGLELVRKRRFPFFTPLIGFGIIAVLVALLLPALRRDMRPTKRRLECQNNLKNISLALRNYADHYGALPPAYTVDGEGRLLHSWRTLILPYLDQQELYRKIDLTKPWNDTANADAFKIAPSAYRCPGAALKPNCTSYLGVVGENTCFHPTRPRAISEITDGTSNTLMVFEVAQEQAVHWMAPLDASEVMVLSFRSDGKIGHEGGTQVALVDGSVRYISDQIPPETLRALISIAGNDQAGEF